MAKDLRRLFVQLIKDACEKYLAEERTLGWDYDFEIEQIELVPADQTKVVDYSYSLRRPDGSWEDIFRETTPFEFVVRYWNEYGGGDDSPSNIEKRLGFCEVLTEVGKLIAGQVDRTKACNAMHWLRGDTHD